MPYPELGLLPDPRLFALFAVTDVCSLGEFGSEQEARDTPDGHSRMENHGRP